MARETFPGFWYSPEGEAKVFQDLESVPEGWANAIRSFDENGKPLKGATVKSATKAPSKSKSKKAVDDPRTDEELRAALVDKGYEVGNDDSRADMLDVLKSEE